ncbi:TonB-dependent siderophore receptor [Arsukibacterium perlucidum]|uniref:TonB-dependent siderophore receptor n=1 Tax=Arsukibacterium perlucidum TaxID=368811 RepID=UPI00037A5347|nr:TonB-dependent receptor [Arsukibacterium perlucidum]
MNGFQLSAVSAALLSFTAVTVAQTTTEQAPAETAKTKDYVETIEVIGRFTGKTFSEYSYSATKVAADVLDIPQSISAVTKETIKDQAMMRLNDISPFVSGVNEFSVYNDITIRGFRNWDDRRVNGMRTYNDFWSQSVIAHVERVEVIKGPASAIFGDASPGGTVNMVTKKPLSEQRNELSARVGSYADRYIAFDTTGPATADNSLLYRLNLGYEDSDSFRNQIFNKSLLASPSVTWLPTDNTRVNVELVYADTKGILDRGQPNLRNAASLGQVPIEVSVTQPGDKMDTESLSTSVAIDHKLTDGWSVVFNYMYQDYQQKLIEHRIRNYVEGSDSVINLLYVDRDENATVDNVSAYLTGVFQLGRVSHSLVAGVDYVDRAYHSAQLRANNVDTFDILQPVYQRRDPASYGATADAPWGGDFNSTGWYIQDQMDLGNWSLLLSVRAENYDIVDTDGFGADDNAILPRAGAIYRLSPDSSLYATWVTGFEPQDLFSNNPQSGGPFDPQDSELLEVGYKTKQFDGNLLLTLSAYQITKNNIILYDDEATQAANDGFDKYRQRGEEQARGVELEVNGQLTDQLAVIANYAFNRGKITEDTNPELVGKTKEGAPKHSASLWTKYQFSDNWAAGAGVSYVGERRTFEQALNLPAYSLWNAALYYKAGTWDAALQLRNITDKVHWTGGYNFGRIFPGDPRSASLTFSYRF